MHRFKELTLSADNRFHERNTTKVLKNYDHRLLDESSDHNYFAFAHSRRSCTLSPLGRKIRSGCEEKVVVASMCEQLRFLYVKK